MRVSAGLKRTDRLSRPPAFAIQKAIDRRCGGLSLCSICPEPASARKGALGFFDCLDIAPGTRFLDIPGS
jgi:hypothetical protein